MSFILVLLGIALAIIIWAIMVRNNLVRLEQYVKNAFSQIEVQLKRRLDLIPNLVNTVKGMTNFEKETLTQVIEARNATAKALDLFKSNLSSESASKELAAAASSLSNAMRSFNLVVEQYPELKSQEHVKKLMEELTSTENKVSFARQSYNDSVTDFNTYKKLFPNCIVANNCGFTKDMNLLVFENAISEVPKVQF
ncbi:MAG: LemA family protein [Succinivibrionaceae bacterium]